MFVKCLVYCKCSVNSSCYNASNVKPVGTPLDLYFSLLDGFVTLATSSWSASWRTEPVALLQGE